MIGDIHTSETLQQQFPDIYKDFFAKHNLVVSAPYSIRRSPQGLGNQHKLATMLTKIPLYQYIGIHTHNGKNTAIDIMHYEHEKKSFSTLGLHKYLRYADVLQEFLDNLFEKYGVEEYIQFSILSESGRGRGFGFTGTLCTLLGYYIVQHNTIGLAHEQSSYIQVAMELENRLRGQHTNGDRIVTAIQQDASSIYYVREYIEQDITTPKLGDKKNYTYIPLDESGSIFPFDYCVLFSGAAADVSALERSTLKHKKKRDQRIQSIQDFESTLSRGGEISTYIGKTIDEKVFFDLLYDTFVISVVQFLVKMKEIMEWNDDTYALLTGIRYINEMTHVAERMHGNQDFIEKIQISFEGYAPDALQSLGVIPLYIGKYGGSYLLVTPYGKYRQVLDQTIKGFQQDNKNVSLEHCSRRDASTTQGILTHQHISAGMYSAYIHKDYVIYMNNQGMKEIGTYSDLFEKYSAGFLLDISANRVYLNGKKLTKEDIKSQTTTVEIVSVLLDHIGEHVASTEFDPSTYTRQQNQMLGKIIGPLRKLTKEHFNVELPLSCTGNLREFDIKLDPTDVVIGKISSITG